MTRELQRLVKRFRGSMGWRSIDFGLLHRFDSVVFETYADDSCSTSASVFLTLCKQSVILASRPPISIPLTSVPPALLDELISDLSSLASAYHKPASTFIGRGRSGKDAQKKREQEWVKRNNIYDFLALWHHRRWPLSLNLSSVSLHPPVMMRSQERKLWQLSFKDRTQRIFWTLVKMTSRRVMELLRRRAESEWWTIWSIRMDRINRIALSSKERDLSWMTCWDCE